jgi:hypothetical protein
MRTQKRYLRAVDEVAVASPIPPHPTLAQIFQNHRFDILKISPNTIGLIPPICIFHLHGKPSLYRIWRLNHHGEDHSSNPQKRDLKDI